MKFLSLSIALMLSAPAEATSLKHHHHHHFPRYEYVSVLPDVRADTITDADIAAHEKARNDAAKVKKNPQASLLSSIRQDLEQINNDMSFGISYSQHKRNAHAKELAVKSGTAIKDYAKKLIETVNTAPDEVLTEQNAHNIAALIFYDVQLEDQMKSLGMEQDTELVLAVNRLKSL